MKTTLYIIAVAALLFSCDISTKGSWTEEDKAKIRTELEDGKEGMEENGIDFEAFVDCVTEKCEQNYSSFTDADSDLAGCEVIGTECVKSILGDSESTAGNWSKEDIQRMEDALDTMREGQDESGPDLEPFFECYTSKVMMVYNSYYDADSDIDGCTEISQECVTELGL